MTVPNLVNEPGLPPLADATAPAIEIAGLRKVFGQKVVLDDLALEVRSGEILALLGPNGAGKTTTLEILQGFQRRDAGQVSILGLDPGVRRDLALLRRCMGIVLQSVAVDPYLTVRETLTRVARYYSQASPIESVLDMIKLTGKSSMRVSRLSGGERRRLDFGVAIIGQPSVLFLDEPSVGFDVSIRKDIWETIRQLNRGGMTILLTTHYMEEAAQLAHRIAILRNGTIVTAGSLDELRSRAPLGTRVVWFEDSDERAIRSPFPYEMKVIVTGGRRRVQCSVETEDPLATTNTLTAWLLERSVQGADISVTSPNLDDLYEHFIGTADDF